MFEGSAVAIVTPFKRDSSVDFEALKRLIDFQAQGGTDAILFLGTTGESPTLPEEQHKRVIEFGVEYTKINHPGIYVIAGAGTNSTEESKIYARHAGRAGADAILAVTPYYNRPPQEGLFRHFTEVADCVDIPTIAYDIAARVGGVKIEPATRSRILKASPNVQAFKEASGLEHFLDCYATIERQRRDGYIAQKVKYFSGDDALNLAMIAHGAHGAISVVANVAPELTKRLVDVAREGNLAEANDIYWNQGFYDLSRALFTESNPIPVKTALSMMEMMEEVFRLPMTPMAPQNRQRLEGVLRNYGLINK
ncbi:4-hydroxy-tetrahydrodipicolinate synthase [Candidatus Woesearchaeota archaeon]|nr:4-hydroxy-tetrahydrodipicolinate synthase [Candidatus Woesearchaeota archaeon]